jgi:glutathione synthase/RimK-type ligase-like ATP-grasp enzyme
MKILILTDYKGFFGSKQYSEFYRGGMDISLLVNLFDGFGFEVEVMKYSDFQLHFIRVLNEKPIVLYQSQEDQNSFYKSYIEDVIYDLEQRGIIVLPSFACLKAHNNKVSMELLRTRSGIDTIQTINSKVYGTREELIRVADQLKYPIVIKTASGAMSKGVALASDKNDLIHKSKKIASSKSFFHDVKEHLRGIKYKAHYIKESFYRNKFITQNLISGLDNDWKVLVYGDTCFALYRGVRDNDFRASGSGKFVFKTDLPKGMLDYAWQIRKKFNVPHISLDIAFDGEKFHLIEFQFINFGTTTLEKSSFYFEKENNEWKLHEAKANLEEIYVKSTVDYINQNLTQ